MSAGGPDEPMGPRAIWARQRMKESTAMAYMNDSRALGASIFDRFAALRASVALTLKRRRVYRTTLTELSSLTDRDLADLGIARSQITAIARDAAEEVV